MRLSLVALDGGRIGIASQSTGIAEACLDEMISYARQRVQFGQPIAKFQAIQAMIADSRTELAAAKLLIAREKPQKRWGNSLRNGCLVYERLGVPTRRYSDLQ